MSQRAARAAFAAGLAVAAGLGAVAALGTPAARADASAARADWARGLLIATGVGVADRHAPSPIAARGPARRAAEEAAKKQLAAALPALPLAEGGTLASRLTDAGVRARVDRAVAASLVLDAEPSTDGSWRVSLGLPLEALRQALTGPRSAGADDAAGPEVVVVTLDRPLAPAIGYRMGAVAAPALWVKDAPAWAKTAPRVTARAGAPGVLELASPQGAESTLFVIVPGG